MLSMHCYNVQTGSTVDFLLVCDGFCSLCIPSPEALVVILFLARLAQVCIVASNANISRFYFRPSLGFTGLFFSLPLLYQSWGDGKNWELSEFSNTGEFPRIGVKGSWTSSSSNWISFMSSETVLCLSDKALLSWLARAISPTVCSSESEDSPKSWSIFESALFHKKKWKNNF